jgi:chitin synthase
LDKVGSAAETLTLADSLTLMLSNQVFTPNYRCDSATEFSIRHNFALGEWVPYDAEAGFVAGNTVQSIESYVSDGSFLKDMFGVLPQLERPILKSRISELCQEMENARVWTTFALKPTPSQVFNPSSWDVSLVSSQVRTFHLAQHHARLKNADYTTDFTIAEFYDRYSSIFPRMPEINIPLRDKIIAFLDGRKLPMGEWHVGHQRVWVGELGWENLEGELDDCIAGARGSEELLGVEGFNPGTPQMLLNESASGFGFYGGGSATAGSREGLLDVIPDPQPKDIASDKYYYGMDGKERVNYGNDVEARNVEVVKTTTTRKVWVFIVWFLTWPIPGFVLRYIGRMKRKDVQMAWREKVTICFFIFLLCGTIIFYIIFFQRLICPEFDKVVPYSFVFCL